MSGSLCTKEEAINKFEEVCNRYKDANPTFIKYILTKKNEYWEFMRFDNKIRKYINNTNVVENFNSVLDKDKSIIRRIFSINRSSREISIFNSK